MNKCEVSLKTQDVLSYLILQCCHFFASEVPVPVTAAKRPEAAAVEPLLIPVPGLLPRLLPLDAPGGAAAAAAVAVAS